MPLPFFSSPTKKRDQIIAVDLGGRSTKAVLVQQKGDVRSLARFCVLDAPIYEKGLSVDLLTEHLKAVYATMDTKSKYVCIAVGVNDAIVRQAELPPIPVDDIRQILKNNSKNYLQQDLPGYVFDCHFILNSANREAKPAPDAKASAVPLKMKVLVGGAKKQLIDDIQTAVKQAGLVPDQIVPGLICPANAFELAVPEIFAKDTVALVDIGFKGSSICVFQKGELILSRVVAIGGDRLTQGLAESMSISYSEAEGIKIGMPTEVQSVMEALLMPLGRELRASMDFFEHQQDRTVNHIYVSGASARSELILRSLEAETMAPCRTWNPVASVQLALPPAQLGEIEQVAPQLAVAMGAAAAAL